MFTQIEVSTAIERIQKLHDDLLKLPDLERLGVPCVDTNLDNVQVSEVVAGSLFKAVTDDGEGGQQEALFTIIGVLGSKDFPPVAWRDVQTQSPLKLSQSLVVYGCGTSQFNCVEQLMADVNWMASQHLAGSKVYLLDPVSSDRSMGLSLALNTRYFTPSRSIIPEEVKAPFGSLRGSKRNAGTSSHCEPRPLPGQRCAVPRVHRLEVRLLPLRDRGLTATRFEAINPAAFHTRNVVQASFAINIFHTLTDGEPQFAVKAVLRAIGRLDCQFAKDAYMASQKASSKHRAQPEGNA
ncbi:hypothetical protein C8F01DRAFT_1379510 [Mycena amicta]|nr:hypothetical protein C8F01DRAFT_1379510 [Mycena amicta]